MFKVVSLASIAISVSFIAGCKSEGSEIEEAVQNGLGLHRACYEVPLGQNKTLPIVVPSRIGTDWVPQSRILAGLRNAGMIQTSKSGWGQPNRAKVTLTEQGREANVYSEYAGFCLGYPRLVELVSYKLDADTGRGTAIATYELSNTPSWFEPNLYQFAPGVAKPQEVQLTLRRRDGSWRAVLSALPD